MNQEIKQRWIEALRSGEYEQADSCLKDDAGAFCCLGVLCDLHAKETGTTWDVTRKPLIEWEVITYLGEKEYLPVEVQKWAGLSSGDPTVTDPDAPESEVPFDDDEVEYDDIPTTLSDLNDNGHSFGAIAQIIEEQL